MKRISLTDDIIMPALQALMEATWLYAAILMISAMSENGIQHAGFLQIFSLLTVAAWVTRLSILIPHQIWSRILLVPVLILILLAWSYWAFYTNMNSSGQTWIEVLTKLWPTELGQNDASVFFMWLIGLYLTVRGVWMGFSRPDGKIQARWLLVGMAFFILLFAILPNISHANPHIGEFRILFLVYFVVGLVLLAIINTQRRGKFTGGQGNFSFSWLVAISIPIILVILLGLIFTGRFSAAMRWLFEICRQIAGPIGSFFMWLSAWLAYWLSNLKALPPGPRTSHLSHRPIYDRWDLFQSFFKVEAPSGPATTISISIFVLILAALAVVVFLMLRRHPHREDPILFAEERTSLWSWRLLWNQIKKILLHNIKRKAAHSTAARFSGHHQEVKLAEIRMIYRRFLEWAAAHKRPRHPAQTPLEHINVISDQATTVSLHTIAECYHDVRYGEITATPVDVERARHALRVLEKIEDTQSPHPEEGKTGLV